VTGIAVTKLSDTAPAATELGCVGKVGFYDLSFFNPTLRLTLVRLFVYLQLAFSLPDLQRM